MTIPAELLFSLDRLQSVAVGTEIAPRPRTDPYVRHYRMRPLPWVMTRSAENNPHTMVPAWLIENEPAAANGDAQAGRAC